MEKHGQSLQLKPNRGKNLFYKGKRLKVKLRGMLRDWPRPLLKTNGGEPFLHYVLFGKFDLKQPLNKDQYRTAGITPGLDVSRCSSADPSIAKMGLFSDYVWKQLVEEDRALTERIAKAPECLILRGQPSDSLNLNYLRDTVGVITHFAERGTVAIYDPLIFRWVKPLDWKTQLFKPNAPVAHRHIAILESQEKIPSRFWFHTLGMRKFGRPDISIKNGPVSSRPAILELCQGLITMLAQGGVVESGQRVKKETFPQGLICKLGGDENDPDFHNRYILINWPTY